MARENSFDVLGYTAGTAVSAGLVNWVISHAPKNSETQIPVIEGLDLATVVVGTVLAVIGGYNMITVGNRLARAK